MSFTLGWQHLAYKHSLDVVSVLQRGRSLYRDLFTRNIRLRNPIILQSQVDLPRCSVVCTLIQYILSWDQQWCFFSTQSNLFRIVTTKYWYIKNCTVILNSFSWTLHFGVIQFIYSSSILATQSAKLILNYFFINGAARKLRSNFIKPGVMTLWKLICCFNVTRSSLTRKSEQMRMCHFRGCDRFLWWSRVTWLSCIFG